MLELKKILSDYRTALQTFSKVSQAPTKEDLTKLYTNISKLNKDLEKDKGITAIPADLANGTVLLIGNLKTQMTKSKIEKASAGIAIEISRVGEALDRAHTLIQQKSERKSKNVSGVESDQLDL